MPPKKRSEGSRNSNGRLENLQTDHDLFLHAFESKLASVLYNFFF